MSTTDGEDNLLFTREELSGDIDSILCGDEHSPEALARLFVLLGRAIDGGIEGAARARNTLRAAVEVIYPHSGAYAAGAKLYRLSVEGELKVADEPLRLIGAAIETKLHLEISQVIPLPGLAGMGFAGLGLIAIRRRRAGL